jgi:hypothetical protein
MLDIKDLTLADWFAGQALAGMMSLEKFGGDVAIGQPVQAEIAARRAYEIADAMMQERRKHVSG